MSSESVLDAKALAGQARRAFAENDGHFDANAILRGAQLTIVGGELAPLSSSLANSYSFSSPSSPEPQSFSI